MIHVLLALLVTTLVPVASPGQTPPGDAYLCYKAALASGQPKFTPVQKTLEDQFGTLIVDVKGLLSLCNPTLPAIARADVHQVGYKLTPAKTTPAQAKFVKAPHTAFDQFGIHPLVVVKPMEIRAPSAKALGAGGVAPVDTTGVDHFECYQTAVPKGTPKFVPLTVPITDQFGPVSLTLTKVTKLCTPVNKNGEDVTAPGHVGHLVCYQAKLPAKTKFTATTVSVHNTNFGAAVLEAKAVAELCVPAFKDVMPTTTITTLTTTTTAQSTTTTTITGTCSVEVDKQVSCDGGLTFHDVGFTANDGDGTADGCTGWNAFSGMPAEPVTVRYVVRNTGNGSLTNCMVTESNEAIGGAASVPTVAAGESSAPIDRSLACNDPLDDGEPDRAEVTCGCGDPAIPGQTVTAFDRAWFTCLTPEVNVQKTCAEQVNGGNLITIGVCNSGTAPLDSCNLTDTVYTAESDCQPPLAGSTVSASTNTPADFALAAGECRDFTGNVAALASSACSEASVECSVSGSSKTVRSAGADLCEVGSPPSVGMR